MSAPASLHTDDVELDAVIVLSESSFWFRFRSVIQFLPLWSMDDKAEAELKTVFAKYYEPIHCVQRRLFVCE